jgi:hypothetical protein
MTKVSYHVAHCSFLPERVAWLEEFKKIAPWPFKVVDSTEKVHASVWARRLWQQCAEEDLGENPPDWHVLLNDDVRVCPIPGAFEAALSQAESQIVALHTSCTNRTDIRWVGCYWMTGPGYAFRRGHAQEMLNFYDFLPKEFSAQPGNNEDIVGILNAWSRQEPIWSTIPALVQHMTEIPSTLGYDNHPLRTSPVAWDHPAFKDAPLGDPDYWDEAESSEWKPPFVENPWMPSARLTGTWKLLKDAALQSVGDAPSPIMCCFCVELPLTFRSDKTGMGLCKRCLLNCVAGAMGFNPQ